MLKGIMLSKISEREKDKYCMVSLYVESQNKTRQDIKLIDKENILMVARGGGQGVGEMSELFSVLV